MCPAYIDEEAFAVSNGYATWAAYTADNVGAPLLADLTEMIEEATEIINFEIGTYNTNITDVRFLSRVEKLCGRMVNRMMQIKAGQGLINNIPLFSPNDFLIERERLMLNNIGKILTKRKNYKWVF